ncbi:putative metH1 [Mycobacterium xenopi 3993]|nr:putative metH1 [Mycobacterium xenopi 3993]
MDERALFLGQWGLRGARGGKGPSYEELVETEGRPRLRYWLDRLSTDGILAHAAVVYGYFRRSPSATTSSCSPSRPLMRPSGSGSPSRASSAAVSCVSPTSSGLGRWPPNAVKLTCWPSNW